MQAGDTGIFVTCHRGKEGKCTGEVLDLLQDYAERIYSSSASASSSRSAAVKEDGGDGEDDGDGDGKDEDGNGGEEVVVVDDIEKEILAEVREIRKPKVARLFTPVQLNVQCGKCAFSNYDGRERNGSMLTHHCRYQSSSSKQHPQSSQFL